MAGTSGNQEGPPVTTAEAIRPPRGAFAALTSRSYRIYLVGPEPGQHRHLDAEHRPGLAVLDLTHSATAVGVTMALQFLPMLLLRHAHRAGGRPAAEAAHPAGHANAERRRRRRAGRHHHRWRRPRRCRVRVRARERSDLRVRRASPAGVRDRSRAPRTAPRSDRAERCGIPVDPADRAGDREPAHRERGHGLGVRRQRRLLRRPDDRPAAAAAVRSHARSGRPARAAEPCGRPRATCAAAPTSCGRSSWSGCSEPSASTSRSC